MANRKMATVLIALGTCATLAAGPVWAETRTSREEATGIGVGAAVGAAAGGPVGLIVGAAAGAWLGDYYNQKNRQVTTLTASLETTGSELGDLQVDMQRLGKDRQQLDRELARLRAVARPELLSLLQTGIEMDLLFRTDEFVLADTTGTRLSEFAATLAGMQDVRIQLDGFADERGAAAYNHLLSTRRAEYVRELLVNAGVAPERIKLAAHGESPAIDSSIDSYALERRVSLTLYVEDSPSFASNPD
jgi:outer membrane protein OmpA-like peptidoglycan-associated protein